MRSMNIQSGLNISYFSSVDGIRKKIVSLVFVIYWLLILEGVFRKWIFPEYHQLIFFIRDPFVLLVYMYALKGRFFSTSPLLTSALLLSALLLPVMLFHAEVNNVNPIILIYGWRNYFFYIPLAFIISRCFQMDDIRKWLQQNLMMALPMAVLVFFQFLSPPDAYINKALSMDGYIFQVIPGMVRVTGTFTFTAGYSLYAASIFAMVLGCWLKPDLVKQTGRIYLLLATFAAITLISLSGSRTVFFLVALILLGAFAAVVFSKGVRNKSRFIILPVVIIIVGGVIFNLVFPEALTAILARQDNAVREEGSTLARAFSSFYNFTDAINDTPLLGFGLGFGTNAGVFVDTGRLFFRLAEDEWTRTYMELGPFFAVGYIVYRISLVVHLAFGALKAAKLVGDPLPFLLLGFIGMTLLNGPMTMQGTINGYAWLFCGFCLAAVNVAARRKSVIQELEKPPRF